MAVPLRESLPLFPLGTVLYPGAVIPLHIFEERYRALVRHLVDLPGDDPREFGIVAIREGHEVGADRLGALYRVGCTAVLARVSQHADGRFDIVCLGSRRFRLLELQDAGTPYLTGVAQRLDEPAGTAVGDAADRVAIALTRYRELLGLPHAAATADPRELSYAVADAMRLDLAERQALLEIPDTGSRLRAAHLLLRREIALVGALAALPAPEISRAAPSLN